MTSSTNSCKAPAFLHGEGLAGKQKVLNQYLGPDLLITDDTGMKQLPKLSGEYLFEITPRCELRSTMATFNQPLEDWGKLVGDMPAATAILDRFLHHAEVIAITGTSYRLKKRGMRQKPGSNRQRIADGAKSKQTGKQKTK